MRTSIVTECLRALMSGRMAEGVSSITRQPRAYAPFRMASRVFLRDIRHIWRAWRDDGFVIESR
jgi:hypothetical protein